MTGISAKRCYNHASREAAARCVECRQFFCRECVSEHHGSVVCSACLAKLTRPAEAPLKSWHSFLAPTSATVLAFLMVWFFFYLIGTSLLALPSSFHEGTLWRNLQWSDK